MSHLERLRSWIILGPLGHLYGGAMDWLELLARYWWQKVRGRAT